MKKLRIGMVGLNFGRHVIDELLKPPAHGFIEIGAISDLDRVRAQAIADRIGVKVLPNLDAVLADPSLEAVGLFTAPVGRAALIRQSIRAGKHVMTTKPFELDPDAALGVLREAGRLGRVIHLNSPGPLWTQDLAQIRSWREELDLGRPVACRADVWASYRERETGSWHDDPARCPAAPVFRLGIYLINDLVRLLGPVERVQVMQSRLFTARPTADNAQLGLQFANGALGNIFASFCVDDGQFYGNSLVLNHERGTVYRNIGPLEQGAALGGCRLSVVARQGAGGSVIRHADVGQRSGKYQWEAFFKACCGEALAEQVRPEEIVEGVKILAAMARAQESGNSEPV